jgi:hypothetical protein
MVTFCSNFDYFFPVPSSQEHNSLDHLTNPTEASDNEQHHSEPCIQAQPLLIAGSNGKNYFVVPSIHHT